MECEAGVSNVSNSKIIPNLEPIKLLLEIILNKNQKTCDVPVKNIDASFDEGDLSPKKKLKALLPQNIMNNKNSNTIRIKIKLDIFDTDNNANIALPNNTEKNTEVMEIETKTITKMSSVLSLSSSSVKDGLCVAQNEDKICSTTTMRKMSSTVNLTVKQNDKIIENNEETVFFDAISNETLNSYNTTSFIKSELDDESHDHSLWQKVFDKIQNNYNSSYDDENVVKIIHELIIEKYQKALHIIKERINRREEIKNANKTHDINNIRLSEDSLNNVLDLSKDSHENSDEKYYTASGKLNVFKSMSSLLVKSSSEKSASVHLNKTEREDYNYVDKIDTDNLSTHSTSSDKVEYDERKFLTNALGAELMNCTFESQSDYRTCVYDTQTGLTTGTEESIASSNISTLLSISERRKSAGIYSLYSTVKKTMKKYRNNRKSSKSTKSSNDYGYESLDNLNFNYHETSLINDNIRQNEIINQISKALTICRKSPKNIGEDVLIEAEKILLLASLRKSFICKELRKIDYEEVDGKFTSSSVTIKNLGLFSKPAIFISNNVRLNWHYICVIHQGSTIYATKTVSPQDSVISFPDKFHFDSLPSNFEIGISVYGLLLKNKKTKTIKNRCLKLIPEIDDSLKSYFTLLGYAEIKSTQINQTVFNLDSVPQEAPIDNILRAEIETSFRINVNQTGFLTIGVDYKGHPIWNRLWCSLHGSRLSYWNHPSEKEHCEPLGIIDLLNCDIYEVCKPEQDICPNPRTLLLTLNTNEQGKRIQRRYFLSADNLEEFQKWQEQLNLVLSFLKKWNSLNCFLEN